MTWNIIICQSYNMEMIVDNRTQKYFAVILFCRRILSLHNELWHRPLLRKFGIKWAEVSQWYKNKFVSNIYTQYI